MKNSFIIFLFAMALGLFIACDNAGKIDAMQGQQKNIVDSLVNVKLAAIKDSLQDACDQRVADGVQAHLDSIGSASKQTLISPTTPSKPKPKPPTTTITPPPPPPKVDPQKDRGGKTSDVGRTPADAQKARGGKTSNVGRTPEGGTTTPATTTPATPVDANQQKKRGGKVDN